MAGMCLVLWQTQKYWVVIQNQRPTRPILARMDPKNNGVDIGLCEDLRVIVMLVNEIT